MSWLTTQEIAKMTGGGLSGANVAVESIRVK